MCDNKLIQDRTAVYTYMPRGSTLSKAHTTIEASTVYKGPNLTLPKRTVFLEGMGIVRVVPTIGMSEQLSYIDWNRFIIPGVVDSEWGSY